MGRLAASLGFLSDTIFTFCLSPCRQTYPPGQNLSTILHIHKRCYDCRHGFAVRSGGSGNLTKASLLAQRGYGGAQRHGLMRVPIQRKPSKKFGAAGRENWQNNG